jgi:hypothetical protein
MAAPRTTDCDRRLQGRRSTRLVVSSAVMWGRQSELPQRAERNVALGGSISSISALEKVGPRSESGRRDRGSMICEVGIDEMACDGKTEVEISSTGRMQSNTHAR